MEKAELKLIKLDNGDVIATSSIDTSSERFLYVYNLHDRVRRNGYVKTDTGSEFHMATSEGALSAFLANAYGFADPGNTGIYIGECSVYDVALEQAIIPNGNKYKYAGEDSEKKIRFIFSK